MIGLALTGLVALGLIAIAVGALVAPRASSRQYGIPLDDPRALAVLRAMGARDLVIGLLLLLLAGAGRRDLLAWGVAVSAAIALVDLVVVSRAGAGTRARALHAGGALGLLVAALVIAAGR